MGMMDSVAASINRAKKKAASTAAEYVGAAKQIGQLASDVATGKPIQVNSEQGRAGPSSWTKASQRASYARKK